MIKLYINDSHKDIVHIDPLFRATIYIKPYYETTYG
jgi:hypothetical protein